VSVYVIDCAAAFVVVDDDGLFYLLFHILLLWCYLLGFCILHGTVCLL